MKWNKGDPSGKSIQAQVGKVPGTRKLCPTLQRACLDLPGRMFHRLPL